MEVCRGWHSGLGSELRGRAMVVVVPAVDAPLVSGVHAGEVRGGG